MYPKKYAHGFCFAVLCCGYTLTDFPISIRLTSLALWQSNDCPSSRKATRMNMDKYFMWIHYERLRNHNKAKHNKTVCIVLGIYCSVCMNTFPLLMLMSGLIRNHPVTMPMHPETPHKQRCIFTFIYYPACCSRKCVSPKLTFNENKISQNRVIP